MNRPTNRVRLTLDSLDERVVMSATLPTLATIPPAVLVGGDGLSEGTPAAPTDAGATKGGTPAVPNEMNPTKGDTPAVPNDAGATKGGTLATPAGTNPTKGDTPAVPNNANRLQLDIRPSPIRTVTGAVPLLLSVRLTDASGQPITRAGVFTVYLNGVKQGESTASNGVLMKVLPAPYGPNTITVTFGPPVGTKGVQVTTTVRYFYQNPTSPSGPTKGALFGDDVSSLFAPVVVG